MERVSRLIQREVAQRLGVHEQTIAAFENGRKQATGDELIGKMAELFGYDPDEFYYAAQRIPRICTLSSGARPSSWTGSPAHEPARHQRTLGAPAW
ncbi:MAG TPA: helix-turn-helix transcriptional regulator [Chloroflexota bacterium]|nr:helix-turn-helix transcriptional regulator [Chloroflexota bacterium]